MTDRAVLIPTSEGPVGGVVSQPPEEARVRAGLVLIGGYGRPARSGTNSFWTRVARSLAELGVVVLRIDYSREGETLPIGEGRGGLEWKVGFDASLLRQSVTWFVERLGGVPLLFAGSCGGARLSIDLVGVEPEMAEGTFLIAPHLRALPEPGKETPGLPNHNETVDPAVVENFRAILSRRPSWILMGEHDEPDVAKLVRRLGATTHELELEVMPCCAIHMLDQPEIQKEVARRLISRIDRTLTELEPVSRP